MEKDIMLEDVKINFDIYLRALETALKTQKREDIIYSCLRYGRFVESKNKYLDLYGTIDDIDFLQKIYSQQPTTYDNFAILEVGACKSPS